MMLFAMWRKATFLVFCAVLLVVFETHAQQQIPVFASKKDSVDYAQVQQALQDLLRTNAGPIKREVYDSLMYVQNQLRSRIIGFRVIYRPNREFTQYNDIKDNPEKASTLTQLSLSGKEWRKLPSTIYNCQQLEELELVNTSLKKLPARLKKLPRLKAIYVLNYASSKRLKLARNNQVKELIFRGIEAQLLPADYGRFMALEDLDLTGNIGLSAFPDIYRNTALKKLSLIGNQITLDDLPDKASSLEYLNVMGNKITRVPEQIGNFSRLQRVIFSNNSLESIDPAIGKLSRLEELSFYNCGLSSLPASIEQLTSLKQIDLYFNKLTTINISLDRLPALEILYLSNNQLTSLPEEIGSLPNLRELYISNNRLSYLPESMGNLSQLKVFRINNNYFTTFPMELLKLTGLENLDISRNDLRELPMELSQFENLQIFALVDNPWDYPDDILYLAELLRSKGTIVHLNTLDRAIDDR
jgi:Leucine-rich repeat (LRR) protein